MKARRRAAPSGARGAKAAKRAAEAHRDRQAGRMRRLARSARDCGPLPPVEDPERRAACAASLRLYCEIYHAPTFHLGWSEDHRLVIAKTERCVREGGRFAVAMPRGSGKTSLMIAACLWSLLYGLRQFVALVGAESDAATEMLEAIKSEFENNDDLAADFPEACAPIRALEGIAHRCRGQLLDGRPTHVEWTRDSVVLPWVPGAPCSGGVVSVSGILGRIRGQRHTRPDGRTIRPDLALLDDPQTDDSARSPAQCAKREAIVKGAVMGLAGPGKRIAAFLPCTVIEPGDLADRMLDREKNPDWLGERFGILKSLPKDLGAWERYKAAWVDSYRETQSLERATAYYRAHQAEIDAGAEAAWPARKNPDEASAIQHAVNLWVADEGAFFAEYMNAPKKVDPAAARLMSADQVAAKLSGVARGVVPDEATALTGFIDVQQSLLYWSIVAWADGFSGWVVDYGVWPEQSRDYFTLREVKRTLQTATKDRSVEGSVHAGLAVVVERLLGAEWPRENGAAAYVDRLLVDANWAQTGDVVKAFCRRSPHAARLTPSHGRYFGASSPGTAFLKRDAAERVGAAWKLAKPERKRARHLLWDTNHWKTFTHARLAVPVGAKGALSIWGRDPAAHRLFADHLVSEYPTRVEARGRVVDEWRLRAPGLDNHWLDCLVGCAVAGSVVGVALVEGEEGAPARAKKKRRVKWSELQALRREAHGGVGRRT